MVSESNRTNTLNIYLPLLASLSLFKECKTLHFIILTMHFWVSNIYRPNNMYYNKCIKKEDKIEIGK